MHRVFSFWSLSVNDWKLIYLTICCGSICSCTIHKFHWSVVCCILWYIKGTHGKCLYYRLSTHFDVVGCFDVDKAGDLFYWCSIIGYCSGMFPTSMRSCHMFIQHQIGVQCMIAFRTSKRELSFNSNSEQFKWLEERDKISHEHPYLWVKSPFKLSSYGSGTDQQLDADDQIKIDSGLINSN